MARQTMTSKFNSLDSVRKDNLAVAVLLDVAYYGMRKVSELASDLNLRKKQINVLEDLEYSGFIRPNPHQKVADVKYVLAHKGFFLVNELKIENPELLREIDPVLSKT